MNSNANCSPSHFFPFVTSNFCQWWSVRLYIGIVLATHITHKIKNKHIPLNIHGCMARDNCLWQTENIKLCCPHLRVWRNESEMFLAVIDPIKFYVTKIINSKILLNESEMRAWQFWNQIYIYFYILKTNTLLYLIYTICVMMFLSISVP